MENLATLPTADPLSDLERANPDLAREYREKWSLLIAHFKKDLSEVIVNTWLRDVHILNMDDKNVMLFIPNKFQREVVESRYTDAISSALLSVLGESYNIFYIEEDKNGLYCVDLPKSKCAEPEKTADVMPDGYSDYEYTFETFIVGNSNRFAHATSLSVANMPAKKSYNPLFIYGGSGLGKTHLLYAIMHQYRKNFPSQRVVYLKGDDFTNELIQSIQVGKAVEFRSKYRYVDLLLVDDIQFIAGREMTQQEFFHTFNSLYEDNKQIVLTSDRPPNELATLEERLRTRFVWGLIADIQPPDFETRMAIIKRKADAIGIFLPDEVTSIIADNIKTNIRQLEGAVKNLKAYHMLTGAEVNVAAAQIAIKDFFSKESRKTITPDVILDEVSRFYSVSPKEIKSKKRTADLTLPRQVCAYIIRETTDLSLPAIGQALGGRDHTTVLYSIRKMEEEMDKNPGLSQIVGDLIKNLGG